MADDPNPTLRAEYLAALDVIERKLRGQRNLIRSTISAELLAKINERIAQLEHRATLVQGGLTALDADHSARDALEADGYPALPKFQLLGSLFQELQEDMADDLAGADDFEAEPVVSSASTTFPASTPKSPA